MKSELEPLEVTMKAAMEDAATVYADGSLRAPVPDGFRERQGVTHVDDRGTVTELFDTRWDWHPDPFVFAYTYTIREGRAKGWGLHQHHEDRYYLLDGRRSSAMTFAPTAKPRVRFPRLSSAQKIHGSSAFRPMSGMRISTSVRVTSASSISRPRPMITPNLTNFGCRWIRT